MSFLISSFLYVINSKPEGMPLFPGCSHVEQPAEMTVSGKKVLPSPTIYKGSLPAKGDNKNLEPLTHETASLKKRKDYTESKPAKKISPASNKMIKDIRFKVSGKDEESVLFILAGSHTPDTFALEGDRPRIVSDFPGAHIEKDIESRINTNGKIIKQIRFGYYDIPEPRLRVVMDLEPDQTRDYEIQPVFFDDMNIYAIVVK